MSDGERMVLARTERYGGAATVIIWDVLGNEPVRRLVYESPVGFVDQISYVGVSRDNRYIVAGYQVSGHFLSGSVDQYVHCVSKKVPTFELSVTLLNLKRFSKFLHCWKAYEICSKIHTTLPTSP